MPFRLMLGSFALALVISATVVLGDAMPTATSAAERPAVAHFGGDLYWSRSNCCGLLATYMILRDLDVPTELKDTSMKLPVSGAGTTMEAMARHFKESQLDCVGVEIDLPTLTRLMESKAGLRSIVLVGNNHWLPLFSVRNGNCEVYDYPEWKSVALKEFEAGFGGKALLIERRGQLLTIDRYIRFGPYLQVTLFMSAVLLFGTAVLIWFRYAAKWFHSRQVLTLKGSVCS